MVVLTPQLAAALTVQSVCSIVFSLVLFRALCTVVYNLFIHPLRSIPGPKLWAISNLPHALCNCSGRAHERVLDLHKKYGPIVRVGPNDVVLNHPDAWKELLGHRKGSQVEHSKDPYITFDAAHSIVGANREDHGRMRRALSHGFSAASMLGQQSVIQSHVDILIQSLRERATSRPDQPLDVTTWFNWTTFDIIGDLVFGECFGCLKNADHHPWVRLVCESAQSLVYSANLKRFPLLWALLTWTMGSSMRAKRINHRKFVHDRITERLASNKDTPDFIASMTKATGDQAWSRVEVDETASSLILAGSETNATLLSNVIYFIATEPEVMQKLKAEIRSAFNSEDEIDLISVQNLPYMLAVINETLRRVPPAATCIGRQIAAGGDVILGHFLPEGTLATIQHYAMYNNEKYFAQPESFIPERWLDDPRFATDSKEAFRPFSYGPRNCLGSNLALFEARLILARLIWNFDMKIKEESKDWLQKNTFLLVWVKAPLPVYFTPK